MSSLTFPTPVTGGVRSERESIKRDWTLVEVRRGLQLVLASIWLIDGVLQLQAAFYAKSFGSQMIRSMAAGNPGFVAHPISWSGLHIASQAQFANTVFAAVQLLLGLGIAWRPALRPTLIASIIWSIGVWWIGEGLGGVLNGSADPVNGAPGAVILYALLAVLLWPSSAEVAERPFVATMAVETARARAAWITLWGALAYFAVAGTNSASQALHDLVAGEAGGEPGWIAWLDRNAASLLSHHGLAASVVLAVLLGAVALGVFLPPKLANAAVVLAIVLALGFWVIGENFGALLTGRATDVNSGPLLILLAAAYWRVEPGRRPPGSASGQPKPSTEGV